MKTLLIVISIFIFISCDYNQGYLIVRSIEKHDRNSGFECVSDDHLYVIKFHQDGELHTNYPYKVGDTLQ